jgi:hypothetical protein
MANAEGNPERNLDSLPLADLEARCPKSLLDFWRERITDPNEYRSEVVAFARMRMLVDDLLAAIRGPAKPDAAWKEVLRVCHRCAPGAPWPSLPDPDLGRDIEDARVWLARQLRDLPDATGIYLGLDTLNMRGGRGQNVEIGGTAECDALQDSQDWIGVRQLRYGTKHLIRGLYEMHRVYTQGDWCVRAEKVPRGLYSSFAEYSLFLSYSGIVLGHALKLIPLKRTFLVVWGYHDGDMFLLGRRTPDSFTILCK